VRRADRPIASNMKDPLQRLFLREKPSLAVLALSEMEPAYAAQIAKHIDSTFPHTSSILGELEEQGLIISGQRVGSDSWC